MNINASIVDQQVRGCVEKLRPVLEDNLNIRNDEDKARSAAFVFMVIKNILDLSEDDAADCLTEGGNDFGVDAIHLSDLQDGDFTVTLVQGKYKRDLDGNANFPETGVTKAVQAVRFFFDPDAILTSLNDNLKPRIEEIRSLIRDGNIPRVRFILCNNGLSWNAAGQTIIDKEAFPERVRFEHVNHDGLIRLLQSSQPVKDTIRFTGKAIVEDFDYIRVLVGKMAVTEVAELLRRHGDKLLERNIRRYLGLYGNRVNEGIRTTLQDQRQRPSFYFYNNGITMTCKKFDYNALQADNYQVRVDELQIINGGQTCKTIEATLATLSGDQQNLDKSFVLVRLYQLPDQGADMVRSITYATNSQNPVDLRDLRSNDACQRTIELSVSQLGYQYRRQRSEISTKPTDITSATAAEAVLSVWRRRPHQAKFMTREHFGKFYDTIFNNSLNGAQVIIATLLFRFAENRRKRPPAGAPVFLPYASCFISMLMGKYLLADMKIPLDQLSHLNFVTTKALLDTKTEEYFKRAVQDIAAALKGLYGDTEVSLQRLSATFRRGDLIEALHKLPQPPTA